MPPDRTNGQRRLVEMNLGELFGKFQLERVRLKLPAMQLEV